MQFRNLFAAAMSLVMVAAMMFASCQKDPAVTVDNITTNVASLEAKAEGETLRIIYDIKSRTEGLELKATCESDWVSDIKVYPSLIDITVERNTSGAERTTTLVLSYGSDSKSLAISQKPWLDPLTLTIDKIEATAIVISVEALDPETTWIGQIVGKEWYDSLTEEDIFYEDLTYFRQMASDAEMSLEEYLAQVLSKGSHSGIRMKGLDSESDYVVYVYGMSEYGVPTTSIYAHEFRTTAPYEGNDVTYDINVVCERAVAKISIQPSHEGVAYYNNVTTREHFEECGSDINALVEDIVATALDNYLYWEYTQAEFYEYNTSYFAEEYEFETASATDYVVLAFKWDENLKPLSEVSYKWFTSNEVKPSDNQLSMTISEVTQTTFYIETKTTNNDPYTIFAVPTEEIKKLLADSQIFDYIIEEYGAPALAENKCEGDVEGTFSGLEADTDYTVLLFGYEAGTRTTSMVKEKIHTAAAGDVEACTYDAVVSDVADRTANVEITPSDYSVWYYWNVFEASTTEDEIKAYIDQTIQSYYYGDYSEFSWYEIGQGEVSSSLSQLRPSTDYKVVIVPMNPYKYEYTGTMRTVAEFTTNDAVYADITITATFDAYYDGDELHAIEGDQWDFSIYKGLAVVPIHVQVNGDYSRFLYSIFEYEEGIDDPEVYADDLLLDALYSVGAYWSPAYFRCEWDTPLLIAAVAFDKQGIPSHVYRQLVTFSRDGASPAEEFIEKYYGGTSTSAALMSAQHPSSSVAKAPICDQKIERNFERRTRGLDR